MQFLVAISVLLALCTGLPIPSAPLGQTSGSPSAKIHLDMFIDWQCSNSMYSWGTLKQVLAHFGDKIYFTFYVSHIWHFRQSADLAIAVNIITQNNKIGRDDPKFFDIAQFFFDHQPEFWNAQNWKVTQQEFVQSIATYATQNFGVSNTSFYANYLQGESGPGQIAAAQEVRYSYLSGAVGTPTFRLNGIIDTSVDSLTTYEQWVTYLTGFLKAAAHKDL